MKGNAGQRGGALEEKKQWHIDGHAWLRPPVHPPHRRALSGCGPRCRNAAYFPLLSTSTHFRAFATKVSGSSSIARASHISSTAVSTRSPDSTRDIQDLSGAFVLVMRATSCATSSWVIFLAFRVEIMTAIRARCSRVRRIFRVRRINFAAP